MKLAHLADLHIGKSLYEFSLIEDQEKILSDICKILIEENIDGVMIAGDVYDRSIPSLEAVNLYDKFLTELSEMNVPIFVICGNHDSNQRMYFGAKIFANRNVFISKPFSQDLSPIRLEDAYGSINFYLLPYIKPINVRKIYPDFKGDTFPEAIEFVMDEMKVDTGVRNVLIAHQFVTGGIRSDSEETYVGSMENVDASLFDDFDYVALGHLHNPQQVGRPEVRYAGTPLKYSFSEMKYDKSVTIVEIGEKGTVNISAVPLNPLRNLVEIKGRFAEVIRQGAGDYKNRENFVKVVLTDEYFRPGAINFLREYYPNIVKLEYDNKTTRAKGSYKGKTKTGDIGPNEIVRKLYMEQNDAELTDTQSAVLNRLIDEIWRSGDETN